MEEVFIKKYWADEDTWFFIHFRDGKAVEQVELTPNGKVVLSLDNPTNKGSMLFDQGLDDLNLGPNDFMTKDEFYEVWND